MPIQTGQRQAISASKRHDCALVDVAPRMPPDPILRLRPVNSRRTRSGKVSVVRLPIKTTAACAPKAGSTSAAAQSSRISRAKTGFLPGTGSPILKPKGKSFLYRQHRLECLSGPQFIHRECAGGIHQHRVCDAKIGVVLDCLISWFWSSGFWIHIEG